MQVFDLSGDDLPDLQCLYLLPAEESKKTYRYGLRAAESPA